MTSEEADPIKTTSETMVFSSMKDVKAHLGPVETVEEPPPESLEDPAMPPPPQDAVSVLRREAEEAGKRVHHLKMKRQSALREYDRLEVEIREAETAASEAYARYRENAPPPPLPPVPSFEECIRMAKAQRPMADHRETVRMAANFHANMSDGLARAGEGIAYRKPIPTMEGPEVRNVEDHRYELDAPPKDAPPGQHRGTVRKYG